jgi:hypothetical protein
MGMFDNLHYDGHQYQTKDTPMQGLDNYKIEHDQDSGHIYLWHEEYDSEWHDDPDSFLGGYLRTFNERWVQCHDFDGNIRFYREDKDNGGWDKDAWITYSALFMDGKLLRIKSV